jgi:hypothetical protein
VHEKVEPAPESSTIINFLSKTKKLLMKRIEIENLNKFTFAK